MEEVKRSRKSKIKKRPQEWDNFKVELAKELGLWDKVKNQGWAGLSAEESGRLGGVLAARKKTLTSQQTITEDDTSEISIQEILDVETGLSEQHKNAE